MNKGIVALALVFGLLLFGYFMAAETGVAVAHSQTLCPVMDMKIDRHIHAYAEGKRVYLCCKDCKEKFEAAPAHYIKKLENLGVVLETDDL